MNVEIAVQWTARLLAWSMLLQTIELWLALPALDERYPWSLAGPRWLAPVLGERGWPWLLAAQALCALGLGGVWWAPWPALALALLQAVRFRGSFNGGSDSMTLVVLLGLALARTLHPQLGLGYIAAQLVLSYFLAGMYKLRAPDWRDGSAVPALLRAPQYHATLTLPPGLARWAGYGVIIFECAFPLALVDARVAVVLVALGISFHVFNAWALGLNRFLWAWLAAYPALWFWAQR